MNSFAKQLTLQAASVPRQVLPAARVQDLASNYGLQASEVDEALRNWAKSAAAPEDRALGELYVGQYVQAADHLGPVIEAAEKQIQQETQRLAELYLDQGYALYMAGKPVAAEASYEKSFQQNPNNPVLLNNFALVLRENGKLDDSAKMLRKVVEVESQAWGTNDLRRARGMNNLGLTLAAQNNFPEAESLFQQTLDLRNRSMSPGSVEIAYSLAVVGAMEAAEGKCESALAHLAQADSIYQLVEKNEAAEWAKRRQEMNAAEKEARRTRKQAAQPQEVASTRPAFWPALHRQQHQPGQQEMASTSPAPPPMPHLPSSPIDPTAGKRDQRAPAGKSRGFVLPGPSSPEKRKGLNQVEAGQPGRSRILLSAATCTTDKQKQQALLQQSLELAEKQFGKDHLQTTYSMVALGEFERNAGNEVGGVELLRRALAIRMATLRVDNPLVTTLAAEVN